MKSIVGDLGGIEVPLHGGGDLKIDALDRLQQTVLPFCSHRTLPILFVRNLKTYPVTHSSLAYK